MMNAKVDKSGQTLRKKLSSSEEGGLGTVNRF